EGEGELAAGAGEQGAPGGPGLDRGRHAAHHDRHHRRRQPGPEPARAAHLAARPRAGAERCETDEDQPPPREGREGRRGFHRLSNEAEVGHGAHVKRWRRGCRDRRTLHRHGSWIARRPWFSQVLCYAKHATDRREVGSRLRIDGMTVSRGREFLSIPGPTNIPEAVLAAMHRPAIDIYAGDMVAVTHTLLEDLPKIFRTTGRTYIYAANGHGGWEAALTNVLSRGETVLVLESGLFALGWGDMARMMGVKVEVVKGDPRRAVDPAALAQRLAADTAREIKAILVVQIDTASGVVNDVAALHRAIASVGHPALLMVDAVAS